MTSFYYDDQSPSGFSFLVQIRTFVIYLAGITKFEHERKNVKDSGHSGKIIPARRVVKKFLSSRLIMNSRRLNLVQLAPKAQVS